MDGDFFEIVELAMENIPLFNAEVPDIRRIAFDIEVKSPRGIFATPTLAEYPVHAIGIYDSDDRAIIQLFGIHPSQSQMKQAQALM